MNTFTRWAAFRKRDYKTLFSKQKREKNVRQELLCSGGVWGNSSFEHTISYDETFWRKRIALRKCSEHKRLLLLTLNDFRRISFNHWFLVASSLDSLLNCKRRFFPTVGAVDSTSKVVLSHLNPYYHLQSSSRSCHFVPLLAPPPPHKV